MQKTYRLQHIKTSTKVDHTSNTTLVAVTVRKPINLRTVIHLPRVSWRYPKRDMRLKPLLTEKNLVRRAAPFCPRWRSWGCSSTRASRKFSSSQASSNISTASIATCRSGSYNCVYKNFFNCALIDKFNQFTKFCVLKTPTFGGY